MAKNKTAEMNIKQADRMLGNDPNSIIAFAKKATNLKVLGKDDPSYYDRALECYDRAIEIMSGAIKTGNTEVDTSKLKTFYVDRGQLYYDLGQYKPAIEDMFAAEGAADSGDNFLDQLSDSRIKKVLKSSNVQSEVARLIKEGKLSPEIQARIKAIEKDIVRINQNLHSSAEERNEVYKEIFDFFQGGDVNKLLAGMAVYDRLVKVEAEQSRISGNLSSVENKIAKDSTLREEEKQELQKKMQAVEGLMNEFAETSQIALSIVSDKLAEVASNQELNSDLIEMLFVDVIKISERVDALEVANKEFRSELQELDSKLQSNTGLSEEEKDKVINRLKDLETLVSKLPDPDLVNAAIDKVKELSESDEFNTGQFDDIYRMLEQMEDNVKEIGDNVANLSERVEALELANKEFRDALQGLDTKLQGNTGLSEEQKHAVINRLKELETLVSKLPDADLVNAAIDKVKELSESDEFNTGQFEDIYSMLEQVQGEVQEIHDTIKENEDTMFDLEDRVFGLGEQSRILEQVVSASLSEHEVNVAGDVTNDDV